MKVQQLLLLSGMNALVHAGPARRDCGQTSTFLTTDFCGAQYSATWIECESGMTSFPTFTMPDCTPTPVEFLYIPDEPNWPQEAAITPAPILSDSYDMNESTSTTTCMMQSVCVDAVKKCGEGDRFYGRCYDTCTDPGILSTPTCLIEPTPEPTEAQAQALDHWRNLSHQREDFRPDICDNGGKPWMCKPHDW